MGQEIWKTALIWEGLANSVGHKLTEDQTVVLTDMIWVTGNNHGYYKYHVNVSG